MPKEQKTEKIRRMSLPGMDASHSEVYLCHEWNPFVQSVTVLFGSQELYVHHVKRITTMISRIRPFHFHCHCLNDVTES
jgi:hypothetical protein